MENGLPFYTNRSGKPI
ncbi:TPA: hypothetical protein ACHXMN_004362, partial [Shigella flexneri]